MKENTDLSYEHAIPAPGKSSRPPLYLDITTDAHKRLLAYWEEVRGPYLLPAKADLDMAQLIPVLPNIVLFSVQTDPIDFIYKIIGEEALNNFTSNFTGKAISEVPGKGPGSKIFETLKFIVETGQPNLLKVPYVGPNRDFKTIHTLALPFAEDRNNVDKIMILVEFIPSI